MYNAAIPRLDIILGQLVIDDILSEYIDTIRVHQKLSCPTLCELAFSNPDQSIIDSLDLSAGDSLKIGLKDSDKILFDGIITGIEADYGPNGVLNFFVRGYDKLYLLGKTQVVQTFSNMSLEDIIAKIISPLDLEPVKHAVTIPCEEMIQINQSNLEFIQQCSQRYGQYFFIENNHLHLFNLSGSGQICQLRYPDTLLEASFRINDAPAVETVKSSGWDPFSATLVSGQAKESKLNKTIPKDPGLRIGAVGKATRQFSDVALGNRLTADAFCQGKIDQVSANSQSITGVAEGNSDLMPGTTVKIDNISNMYADRYVVTEVSHTINGHHGFISQFTSIPPENRKTDKGYSLTFGIVRSVKDPKKLGRVKVTFPAADNRSSAWLNVLTPGAGSRKGFVMLPGKGDFVVVGFLSGDMARGLILGGLYGANSQPKDWGIENGEVKRTIWMLPNGHQIFLDENNGLIGIETGDGNKITLDDLNQKIEILSEKGKSVELDDKENRVVISDQYGNHLELSEEQVELLSAKNLTISAPGNKVVIRGKKIDFQKG